MIHTVDGAYMGNMVLITTEAKPKKCLQIYRLCWCVLVDTGESELKAADSSVVSFTVGRLHCECPWCIQWSNKEAEMAEGTGEEPPACF